MVLSRICIESYAIGCDTSELCAIGLCFYELDSILHRIARLSCNINDGRILGVLNVDLTVYTHWDGFNAW